MKFSPFTRATIIVVCLPVLMDLSDKFEGAVAEFDRMNSQDPKQREVNGEQIPYEVFFADCMTRWILRLNPEASEVVQLAARCQHLCRWEIPRKSYPEGRVGYLTWRKDLKSFHAEKSVEVLSKLGYEDSVVERVRAINLKQGLGKDPEVQLIEDALCMVFLEQQFDDLIAKTEEAKMVSIIQKTWVKMSEQAQQEALKLKLSEEGARLIGLALS